MSLSDEDFVSQVNHAFVTQDHKNEIASKIEDNLHKLLNLAQESELLPQFESTNP
jgi:hypothetical protein